MNKETVELGFILKQIKDYEFTMQDFDDRLRLQKLIYLLQASGVYLGYDFSWYLRGPYCSQLAHNGFALRKVYGDIPDDIRLKNECDRKNFAKFQKFVDGKDIDGLEIAASLHYQKTVRGKNVTDEDILKKVTEKRPNFTEQKVRDIWGEMKKWQLIR